MADARIGVRITERPLFGALDLRLDPENTAAMQAVATALGATLPNANTWIAAPSADMLWQAFDEWLIVTRDGRQQALAASLHAELADMRYAITDVSDLRTGFAIDGPHARDVLQKGCAVDLHPRAFEVGACVTAALARARVTLRRVGSDEYEALVERSYGRYLRDWLADAALDCA